MCWQEFLESLSLLHPLHFGNRWRIIMNMNDKIHRNTSHSFSRTHTKRSMDDKQIFCTHFHNHTSPIQCIAI